MTQKNNTDESKEGVKKNSRPKKKRSMHTFKVSLLVILITVLIGTGMVGGLVYASIRDVPPIDASNIDTLLDQNSFILDLEGNVIEKVLAEENRTAESLDNMPDHLQKAFIAIEDERFYDHFGVDIRGIGAAIFEDIKAGASVRGASTITQQLAKNVYLTNEKSFKRKIKEAYIAIKLEQQLTKDQILESYLNKIYLGQGAYGVKEAAFTYFSKEDLHDLTLAESALIAGITKNPSNLSPYNTVPPQDVPEDAQVVGSVELSGKNYTAVFNEESLTRQKIILAKMKELGHITEAEYNEALEQDIFETLAPGKKIFTDISSYFVDYVKQQVVDDLVIARNITPEEAHRELLTGGFRIYSTVDLELQKDIEDMYTNFSNLVFNGRKGSEWSTDGSGNIIDSYNKLVYYKKSNLLNEEGELVIANGNYNLSDNGLSINSPKLTVYPKSIDIQDYYTLDNGHLISHNIGGLDLSSDNYSVDEHKAININHEFLNSVNDFYRVDSNNDLIISSDFFLDDEVGIVQPQSATVIMDHNNGQLKALVGGRNFEGNKILNRALTPRQPGSAIKPIAAYLPALDRGYNAGTGVDDVPLKNVNGKPWPKNSYAGYRGIISVREAIRDSSNAASVSVVEDIGVNVSKEYLKKMGIIKDNEKDSFVTRLENKDRNDENSSALGLGGMTRGISPLDMTGAYASIANDGSYVKPMAYTKVEDSYGNVILENKAKKTTVVSPGVAHVMTDMLQEVVTNGTGRRASVSGVSIAGKTGTTSDNTDAWFVGYSPNYTASIWIGNDSPAVKLPDGSKIAAQFWSKVMTRVHRDVETKDFVETDDIVRRSVCTVSGRIPTSLCNNDSRHVVKTELFAKGHEPTETCHIHSNVRIDATSNRLATSNCPASFVRNSALMSINPPYLPSNFGGIIPDDYLFRAPTSYCNINHSNYRAPSNNTNTNKPSKKEPNNNNNDDNKVKDKVQDNDTNVDNNKDNEKDNNENNNNNNSNNDSNENNNNNNNNTNDSNSNSNNNNNNSSNNSNEEKDKEKDKVEDNIVDDIVGE